jgi:hypothetical protein
MIVALSNIARKKPSKRKEETSTSFVFPSLHKKVVNAVSEEIAWMWFHENDSDEDSNYIYDAYVTGRFKCIHICSGSWLSGKVDITIR